MSVADQARTRPTPPRRAGVAQPILAGLVAAVVGWASTFSVVLAGLRAVGASQAEAASGLLALGLIMGLTAIILGLRTRMPISIAWSTPGAALLVASGRVSGGYSAAVGAFLLTGALLALAGFWKRLGSWIGAIPLPLASAMLAGVLLPLCATPVHAFVRTPTLTAPVVLVWALLMRFARRWAVPGALLAAGLAVAIDHSTHARKTTLGLLPHLTFTAPSLSAAAVVGLALPLFIVTMASQNIPGMTVLATYGYRPALGPLLRATGLATVVGACLGAFTINLAAITAALCAGPEADPDPDRRWVASVAAGGVYLVLGLGAALAAALVAVSPPLLIESVAGLALLGALAASLRTATGDEEHREAALITFVVTASGVSPLGIGGAFWGLVAGLAYMLVQRAGLGRS